MLYPIKFEPQYQYRIWGGNKLKNLLNKTKAPDKTGESWELSGVQGALSVVANGFLAGNSIEEISEVYMGDLLGDLVYHTYGIEFPLLIKLIDANDILSIQVHPDDELSKTRHNAYGKTEMWHVIQADPGSTLICGFNQAITRQQYLDAMAQGTIKEFLNVEQVEAGDTFFIPAGRVHATGAGILFAEIQQTSDITYRIFDWNRIDKDGKPRELHTDLAIDAIDYRNYSEYKTAYNKKINTATELANCPYFTTNLIPFDQVIDLDYHNLDSFVIYICLEGQSDIEYGAEPTESLKKGETVLIPATLKNIRLTPSRNTELLEVFIPSSK